MVNDKGAAQLAASSVHVRTDGPLRGHPSAHRPRKDRRGARLMFLDGIELGGNDRPIVAGVVTLDGDTRLVLVSLLVRARTDGRDLSNLAHALSWEGKPMPTPADPLAQAEGDR